MVFDKSAVIRDKGHSAHCLRPRGDSPCRPHVLSYAPHDRYRQRRLCRPRHTDNSSFSGSICRKSVQTSQQGAEITLPFSVKIILRGSSARLWAFSPASISRPCIHYRISPRPLGTWCGQGSAGICGSSLSLPPTPSLRGQLHSCAFCRDKGEPVAPFAGPRHQWNSLDPTQQGPPQCGLRARRRGFGGGVRRGREEWAIVFKGITVYFGGRDESYQAARGRVGREEKAPN